MTGGSQGEKRGDGREKKQREKGMARLGQNGESPFGLEPNALSLPLLKKKKPNRFLFLKKKQKTCRNYLEQNKRNKIIINYVLASF